MEPLEGIDAEIVEGPTDEDGFIKFAQDADVIYAKGMRFSKKVVEGLPHKCRAIVLGSVGVDSVDVAAATARGMPVTNCPDTFIEEVADHAMMLLLAAHRRTIEQDRMVYSDVSKIFARSRGLFSSVQLVMPNIDGAGAVRNGAKAAPPFCKYPA